MDQWTKVDGIKDMPEGVWIVRLEDEHLGMRVHTAMVSQGRCDKFAIVGGYFYFDVPAVVEYRSIPE